MQYQFSKNQNKINIKIILKVQDLRTLKKNSNEENAIKQLWLHCFQLTWKICKLSNLNQANMIMFNGLKTFMRKSNTVCFLKGKCTLLLEIST